MKSKKKFLLLGVGVMGALALGVGATSTFAWFSASSATKNAVADSGNAITAVSGVTKSDAFTVTAVTSADSYGNLILTDDTDGHTEVTYEDGTAGSRTNVTVAATGNAGASVTVTLTIDYVGSATTAAEIEAAWDQAVSSVTLTWADTSDNTDAATREGKGDNAPENTNYLKEVTAANNGTKVADLDRVGAALGTAIPATLGFGTPTDGIGDNAGKKVAQVSGLGSTTIIIGISGIDGYLQDNWTYGFSVTPVLA